MAVTVADITDAWWKKHAPPKTPLLGTGIGEELRKYEKAIAALKAGKITLPPVKLTSAQTAALSKLPNHGVMAKDAAQAYKSLIEVEKKLEKLKKDTPLSEALTEWGAVIYQHKRDMMELADLLK